MSTYVCPDCKVPLVDLCCPRCARRYGTSDGFPVLLSAEPSLQVSREIVKSYDSIYSNRSNVWQDQGRTPEFIRYFAHLLGKFPARRFLEVGCGEGALLAAVSATEKHGTELSAEALRKTRARAEAELCIALGERLPYSDASFDLIASVGVMEHFLDAGMATREIWRVLEKGGRYLVLIHVQLTKRQRFLQKISEYVYPRPHPVRLAKWIAGKLYRPIHQPIQNTYSVDTARDCLERSGFAVSEVINKGIAPAVPLIGPHVTIYVCQKPL